MQKQDQSDERDTPSPEMAPTSFSSSMTHEARGAPPPAAPLPSSSSSASVAAPAVRAPAVDMETAVPTLGSLAAAIMDGGGGGSGSSLVAAADRKRKRAQSGNTSGGEESEGAAAAAARVKWMRHKTRALLRQPGGNPDLAPGLPRRLATNPLDWATAERTLQKFRTAVFRTSDPQHKQLACSKAGKHREDNRARKRPFDSELLTVVTTQKCDCPWIIKCVSVSEAIEGVESPGIYIVKFPDADHNHDLFFTTPSTSSSPPTTTTTPTALTTTTIVNFRPNSTNHATTTTTTTINGSSSNGGGRSHHHAPISALVGAMASGGGGGAGPIISFKPLSSSITAPRLPIKRPLPLPNTAPAPPPRVPPPPPPSTTSILASSSSSSGGGGAATPSPPLLPTPPPALPVSSSSSSSSTSSLQDSHHHHSSPPCLSSSNRPPPAHTRATTTTTTTTKAPPPPPARPLPPPPPMTRISVMTFNVWKDKDGNAANWPARRPSFVSTLTNLNPDILCIQEANPELIKEILNALPGHSHISGGGGGNKEETNNRGWEVESNIFWKTALFTQVEHGTEVLGYNHLYPHRYLFWAKLLPTATTTTTTKPPRPFLVSTAHYPWKGNAMEVETGINIRISAAKRTAAHLRRFAQADPGMPILFMGDLNESFHPVRILRGGDGDAGGGCPLQDCFTALGLAITPTHPARPSAPEEDALPDECLDWILATPHCRPLLASVIRPSGLSSCPPPSDHCPVMAIYDLPLHQQPPPPHLHHDDDDNNNINDSSTSSSSSNSSSNRKQQPNRGHDHHHQQQRQRPQAPPPPPPPPQQQQKDIHSTDGMGP